MIGPDERTTSEYYWDQALSWLGKMMVDVENRDKESFEVHFRDLKEAITIHRLAKKNGD